MPKKKEIPLVFNKSILLTVSSEMLRELDILSDMAKQSRSQFIRESIERRLENFIPYELPLIQQARHLPYQGNASQAPDDILE